MFWNEKNEKESKGYDENAVKEAFARVKTDIFTLGNEYYSIKTDINDLKNQISNLVESIDKLKLEILDLKNKTTNSFYPTHIPTHELKNPTVPVIPTDNPTVPMEIRGSKYTNLGTSTRNGGVPTDKQTNQQTDIYKGFSDDQADFGSHQIRLISLDQEPEIVSKLQSETTPKMPQNGLQKPLKQHIQDAEDILDSLDNLKKEIRLKFKQITNQEMLVFSTIYQLESESPEGVEYKQIASKLQLSESSIREYTQKLIGKGIPVDKIKLNNKKILLKISSKLKNIASLETLLKLREI